MWLSNLQTSGRYKQTGSASVRQMAEHAASKVVAQLEHARKVPPILEDLG